MLRRLFLISLLVFPMCLFSIDLTSSWQVGDLIWNNHKSPPFKEEPVANYSARFCANSLFVPTTLAISPIYLSIKWNNASFGEALQAGYWTSYSIIGYPIAILEYTLWGLPVKIFSKPKPETP